MQNATFPFQIGAPNGKAGETGAPGAFLSPDATSGDGVVERAGPVGFSEVMEATESPDDSADKDATDAQYSFGGSDPGNGLLASPAPVLQVEIGGTGSEAGITAGIVLDAQPGEIAAAGPEKGDGPDMPEAMVPLPDGANPVDGPVAALLSGQVLPASDPVSGESPQTGTLQPQIQKDRPGATAGAVATAGNTPARPSLGIPVSQAEPFTMSAKVKEGNLPAQIPGQAGQVRGAEAAPIPAAAAWSSATIIPGTESSLAEVSDAVEPVVQNQSDKIFLAGIRDVNMAGRSGAEIAMGRVASGDAPNLSEISVSQAMLQVQETRSDVPGATGAANRLPDDSTGGLPPSPSFSGGEAGAPTTGSVTPRPDTQLPAWTPEKLRSQLADRDPRADHSSSERTPAAQHASMEPAKAPVAPLAPVDVAGQSTMTQPPDTLAGLVTGPFQDLLPDDSAPVAELVSRLSGTMQLPTGTAPLQAEPALARHVGGQVADLARNLPGGPVELTLSPEELGKVRLVFHHDNGHLAVQLTTERPETMDLMRRNIETLAQELRSVGYREVSFGFNAGQGGHSGQGAPANGGMATAGGGESGSPDLADISMPDKRPGRGPRVDTGIDIRL